ncbi:PAS domain S-box protein [Halorientalis halophila]|uniref:PAS domain S-box protein n=1 Tax=Halorientalis halophila TaxID=3108499 RepID=UPI003008335C
MSSTPYPDPQLRSCRRQQETLAELGRRSLGDSDAEAVLGEGIAAVAEALDAAAAGAFALRAGDDEAAYRQGIGWTEGIESQSLPTGPESLAGRALAAGEAVADDLDAGSPVPEPEETTDRDGGSALCVPVGQPEAPWGVLLVRTPRRREFSAGDEAFAETAGALLASTLETDRTRHELAAERELRTEIAAACPVGILVFGADGKTQFVNERAEALLGRSNDALTDLTYDDSCWDAVDGDGNPITGAALPFERVAAGETVAGEELGVRRPDGDRVWLSVHGLPLSTETGGGAVFAVSDVTERRQLRSEFEQIYGRISDAFFALDREWQFTHLNERAHELINPDGEELVGCDIWDRFPEAVGRKFKDEYERAMREQETVSFEEYYPAPLDAWFEVRGYPSETGLSVYFRDVTERKARERRIEESERRYRTLSESFPNGIVTLFDRDMKYTLADGQAFADLPVDPEDVEGSSVREAWDEETADALESMYRTALAGEESSTEVPYAGREWVVRAVPITGDDGVLGGMTIAQDITERKERERDLERYRAIVEAVNDGVYVVDDEGRFTAVNETYATMLGYDREELVGTLASRVVDEDVIERVERLQADTEAGRVDRPSIEAEVQAKDGRTVPTEATIAPLHGDEDDDWHRVGVVRDITERKARERRIEESERRYRTLVENFPDGAVGLFDENLEYTAVGGQFLDEVGVDPAERVGSSVYEIYPEALVETVRPHFEAAIAGEASTFAVDYYGRHLSAHTLPVEDADGAVLAGMLVVQDVTEREERQRKLQQRARQQRVVAELGESALEADDLDALMREATERVASVLGNEYCKVLELDPDRRDLLLRQGVGWREGIVGEATVDVDENSQAGYTLLSTEPVVVDDLAAETRFSGPALLTSHGVLSGISTIVGSVDEPWGILGTHDTERREFSAEDVSFVQSVANVLAEAIERHRYQRELEELVADLRESNERLEQFAYAASHDLQEPLRMVSSYLRLLESRYGDQFDADAEEFLAFAVDGADRMRGMIDGLLKYSRVDTRGDPLEPVALDDVLADVRDSLAVRIDETGTEITAESLPRVVGDVGQLRQVFQNLLANAIEYTDDGPPRIHVSAEPAADPTGGRDGRNRWRISVSDEGIGIDPGDAERVFEVFQRLHTNDEHEGGGIGLALCKRIVERHGGDIWVETDDEAGTTVSLTLPAAGDGDA